MWTRKCKKGLINVGGSLFIEGFKGASLKEQVKT